MKPFLKSRRRKKNQFLRPPFWPKILKRGGGSIGPMKSLQNLGKKAFWRNFASLFFDTLRRACFFRCQKWTLNPTFGEGGPSQPWKLCENDKYHLFYMKKFQNPSDIWGLLSRPGQGELFGAVPGSPTHWDTWNFQGVPGTTYLPGQVFSITNLDENSA